MRNPLIKYLSTNQVLTALLVIALGWFLLQIKEVIIALFISFTIMAAFLPVVHQMQKIKLPRALAAAVSYIVFLAVIVVLIMPLIPFFSIQIQNLIKYFPMYLDKVASTLGFHLNSSQLNNFLQDKVGDITVNAYQVTTQVFASIFSILTVFVISFYLLLDEERIKRSVVMLFPSKYRKNIQKGIDKSEDKLGAWVRGQLLLSLSIGVITWFALSIIGLEFALPLALLAGILEIVPTLGPILAAIPAIIVALSISTPLAVLVLIAYIVIQVLENNLLVPRIMERSVGLNPIIVIVAIIAGGKLLGLIGALLSIPFVTLVVVIYNTARDFES